MDILSIVNTIFICLIIKESTNCISWVKPCVLINAKIDTIQPVTTKKQLSIVNSLNEFKLIESDEVVYDGSIWVKKKGLVTQNTPGHSSILYQGPNGYFFERKFTGGVDIRWFGAKGNGKSDDSFAINNAIQFVKKTLSGGKVLIPLGEWGIGNSIIIYTGIIIQGESSGSPNNPGSRLIALPTLANAVIESSNISSEDWIHNAGIFDIQIRCHRQISGDGIHLKKIGEMTTIDRVQVISCFRNGIFIEGDSSPMHLGYLSVHGNGRGGAGSGVYIENSISTSNYIEYLAGDNNKDALLKVSGLYRANLLLMAFKSERWNNNSTYPGNQNVIWLHNGNGGTIIIGAGRVHMGKNVPEGNAIFKLSNDAHSSEGGIIVLGTVEYDTKAVRYKYDIESQDVRNTVKFNNIRGRPLVYNVAKPLLINTSRKDNQYNMSSDKSAGVVERNGLNTEVVIGGSGLVNLKNGEAVINNYKITSNSKIFVTRQEGNSDASLKITEKIIGKSFKITSSDKIDNSLVAWIIIE
ncbi:glycosyl hydrolase family 28-related protein [Larkinella bovis]|uniref:Glycosyl hydrolase family 28-related protein n=1 Tax=Larkinella bovis TaxID=683041 RepID=A0ABW0IH12_9BACT